MRIEAWDADPTPWDQLVERSVNGTFLHTRRYLGYHGARFVDASLVVRDRRGALVGVLAAALDPGDSTRVVSHPGLTYGGLVHDGSLRGEAALDALRQACQLWQEQGCTRLRYKAVPSIYHRLPAEDDSWALFRLGAARARCDLSSTVDLATAPSARRDRRRNVEKARQLGVRVVTGPEHLATLWPLLSANLRERFGVDPVHSSEEIALLASLFPEEIRCDLVLLDDEPVGGVVLYLTSRVWHPQYSAASHRGREVFALDVGFQHSIEAARAAGARWYDFGISTEQDGHVLNGSLYDFKSSFGGGGVTYEQLDLDLL